ncbi:protein kinase domain-containing protein [Paludifilum halophilum]|uniref:Serine/threonine-protein kinase PrkC n=1 Tax=Paludifilum halophilum TaxID=1642702 RepID=A0A235B7J2_9BACL|nr:protein kinase [Paludifilum halophilum]OYD07565.1 hypothetical protein CHM34_11335 [Paludifilum halophilum]
MEGKRLGGRYQIIERVGGGGMAVVYKAKDLILERYVAVKVMNQSLSHDEGFIRRFNREAKAAGSLSHPNVVNVYDVGCEQSTHYMVMEYIEGESLMERILDRGRIPAEEAVKIAEQVCEGLAHAHENGIVHRDIKPHNIMATRDGRYKLTDFGISRLSNSSTITQTGSVMGSVHYFSPEQAQGHEIGQGSDIYSMGIVLYEMVTGRLPFDGEEAVAIALKHLKESVPDPREINPDIPEGICQIIFRAMEKDVHRRFHSVREMKEALSGVLDGTATHIWEASVDRYTPPPHPEGLEGIGVERQDQKRRLSEQGVTRSQKKAKRKGRIRWVALGAALVLVPLLLFSLNAWSDDDTASDGEMVGSVHHEEPSDSTEETETENGNDPEEEEPHEEETPEPDQEPPSTQPVEKPEKEEPEEKSSEKEKKKSLPWKNKEFERDSEHFPDFDASGSDGQYQVSLTSRVGPEFYYDIILMTEEGPTPYTKQEMVEQDDDTEKIEFHVGVPRVELPERGLVIIRIYPRGDGSGDELQKVLERREGEE